MEAAWDGDCGCCLHTLFPGHLPLLFSKSVLCRSRIPASPGWELRPVSAATGGTSPRPALVASEAFSCGSLGAATRGERALKGPPPPGHSQRQQTQELRLSRRGLLASAHGCSLRAGLLIKHIWGLTNPFQRPRSMRRHAPSPRKPPPLTDPHAQHTVCGKLKLPWELWSANTSLKELFTHGLVHLSFWLPSTGYPLIACLRGQRTLFLDPTEGNYWRVRSWKVYHPHPMRHTPRLSVRDLFACPGA